MSLTTEKKLKIMRAELISAKDQLAIHINDLAQLHRRLKRENKDLVKYRFLCEIVGKERACKDIYLGSFADFEEYECYKIKNLEKDICTMSEKIENDKLVVEKIEKTISDLQK